MDVKGWVMRLWEFLALDDGRSLVLSMGRVMTWK